MIRVEEGRFQLSAPNNFSQQHFTVFKINDALYGSYVFTTRQIILHSVSFMVSLLVGRSECCEWSAYRNRRL